MASVEEGGNATFALTLDSAPTSAVTVNYVTATGTAGTSDYTSTSGTVTFAAGQTAQFVNIATTEDSAFEADETFTVTFSGSSLTASVTATGTITNDDVDPSTQAQTFALTTGVNTPTGAAGNDTFDATTSNSLSNGDVLTGGDGTDTLNANLSGSTATVNSTGIEVFSLTVAAAGAATLNMASAAGVTTINNTGSLNDLTLNNLASVPTVNINTNDQDTTLNFSNAALAGSTDDLQVNLDGVTANANVILTRAAGATNTLETVSLNSGSLANTLNDLQTTGVGATALEITGDQNLTITTALDNEIATVSAGSATGALVFSVGTGNKTITTGSGADNITGNTGNDNITSGDGADTISSSTGTDTINTGGGNDKILFANGALTSVDVVDGGTGTNTIEFTTDGTTVVDADLTGVDNVQVLTTTADAQLTSLTLGALAAAAGVTTVNLRDTTAVDSVTVGAGFTNNLTVDLDIDTNAANSVVATAYTGALTVTAADTDIDTAVVTITGGTGSDTLAITASGGTIEAADLAAVTKVETFQIVGTTASISLTLSDANAVGTGVAADETITVNASALTTGVATIDASAENDAKVVITGGGAADIITASTSANFGDNISGGAGNDTIKLSADGALTYIDTIDGGAGDDTLSFVASSTVADVDFTNVSSIKTLSSNAAADNSVFTSLTLGALAQAAGVSVVTTTGTGNDVVTVGAGFTNALTVNLATGNDKVDGSASAAALSIAAAAASITANDTIKGGTSTGDTLSLTADDGTATTTLMTGIDTITVVYAANKDVSITMGANDTQIASGATLTVNASAMTETDEVFTFTGTSSETNGYLSITGGTGADVITGAGAADTISGGAGADVITGGAGADRLTGGAGADTFVYTAVAQSSGAATDTITDFVSGTDKLKVTLDYSSLTTAQTVNATILTAAAGLTNAQASLSGERGQFIYDTDNSKLYINVNADNLITSLDYSIGITAATTAANTIADGDLNFSITGGSGADTITTGGGADTITGGTGADIINVGGGANTVNFAVADAIRATVDLTQGAGGGLDDNDTFTGVFDQISSIASGDTLDFLGLTLANEVADGGAGANKYQAIQGTYAAGVFTVDGTTGTDTLILWNDGTNGDNAVVLVGIVDLTGVTIA